MHRTKHSYRISGLHGVHNSKHIYPLYMRGAQSIHSRKYIRGHGIFESLAKLALGAASSYAANKGLQTLESVIKGPMQEPQGLTVKPAPQGVIKGDILPAAANVTVVNPSNSNIDLGNGYEKQMGDMVISRRPRYGGGMKKTKKGKGVIEDILSSKSNEILNNLKTGKGLYKLA